MTTYPSVFPRSQSNFFLFFHVCRVLNKQLLQVVFSFLGPQSAVALTSKYWLLVVRDSQQRKQASITDA